MEFFKKVIVAVLSWEARLVLKRYKPRIIAVTGSVGKTTTKDAIFEVLAGSMRVRKSQKSFNSEFGVPLTILGCDNAWRNPFKWIWNILRGLLLIIVPHKYPHCLVLEVGADRPGDIRKIAAWLRPDIAVITAVPEIPVHVEFFDSPEAVLREKRALAEHLKPGGTLVINGDDSRLEEIRTAFKFSIVTYGMQDGNDYIAESEEVLYEEGTPIGVRFEARHKDVSALVSLFGTLGRPRVYAALGALAVGGRLGIDLAAAAQHLGRWQPAPGRLRLLKGVHDSIIIDDTYNSSPAAALFALDTLRSVATTGRRIAVMGDMLELGKYSTEAHAQVGVRAAQCADMLITVGFRARATGEAALDNGMQEEQVREYELDEAARAGEELVRELQAGDIVLVKGSQSMRMERAVQVLLADPTCAQELLVRQDEQWNDR